MGGILDEDLPPRVPIPPLAEVQIALQTAVADVTQLEGYELMRAMRTGTVPSTDNGNRELLLHGNPSRRFSQSRAAIALDMESATIAANGFRFRVALRHLVMRQRQAAAWNHQAAGHGGRVLSATRRSASGVGLRAIDLLRAQPPEQQHSRKLRSFAEVPFR